MMHIARLCASGLMAFAPAFALYAVADGRNTVAPGSKWSMDTGAGCVIDARWDGEVRMEVSPDFANPGEFGITLHSPAFQKLASEQFVDFGSVEEDDYAASGSRKSQTSYGARAFGKLLDAFASTNSFQVYRDGVLEIELDMNGFADALDAMRACEVTPDPGKM